MLEIVVVAILVLGVVGGILVAEGEKKAVARTWPAIRPGASTGEPAEEGAPVPGEVPQAPEAEPRKAA